MNIIVNLDKPLGLSSQQTVAAIKKRFKVSKAGHAGTLDPLATGVLLVCLNEATKIATFLADLDKEYVVTAKLGESTDTYDAEGNIVKKVFCISVTAEEIREAAARFVGITEQTPPMFSAIKVGGEPLYKLARKGVEVERRPRRVTISTIDLLHFDRPFFTLRVQCSKGTYIRSLCHDMGEALGVGAHVTELRRTRVGPFDIKTAAMLEELPLKAVALRTIDEAVSHLPQLHLDNDEFRRAQHGNTFHRSFEGEVPHWAGASFIRLKDPHGRLFAIGSIAQHLVKVERLLHLP